MKNLFLLFIAFFVYGLLHAQKRYLEEVTDSVTIQTLTYAQKDNATLDLDVYTPWKDNEKQRPVFIYVHGGGFYTGVRNDNRAIAFCKKIAKHGYIAISIDYRLLRKNTETRFGCNCPVNDKLAALGAATKDLQDAVQFIFKKKTDLGIDTNKIILCGSSAGAETVLSKVYNHSLFDIKADDIRYAGVISLAGAIVDTSIITRDMAIPTMLFHGTKDNLVPYETAPHHYCPEDSEGYLILHGSQSIADKLGKLGGALWLCSVCGEDHSISWKPMSDYFDDMITFCYDFVLQRSERQVHIVIPCKDESNYSDNGDNGINPSR